MIDLASIGSIILAIGGLSGFFGLVISRKKTKNEADSVVVNSAETATKMWEVLASRLQTRVEQLELELIKQRLECAADLKSEKARARKLEIRCMRLERAVRGAGIELPSDGPDDSGPIQTRGV